MSFLDSLLNVGKDVWGWATGNSTSAALARTAALGFALNQLTKSISGDNKDKTEPDYGVREQIDPDTNNSVPVVYGQAYLGGYVTDAYMTDDNLTMWYCLTICEKTGNLLSNGQPSQISIEAVYWNQSLVLFQSNGYVVSGLRDNDGNTNTDMNGLVAILAYSGGSYNPIPIGTGTNPNQNAMDVFPPWTDTCTMDDLVFVLVGVEYNKVKNVTGIGNLEFKVRNTMKKPGDVLYDYMTNTRYGAGIAPEEIKSE